MSRFLKRMANILILGCLIYGCGSPSQPVLTTVPSIDLTPLTLGILSSDEINSSNLLKVDEGLLLSDRSDCLPEDCAFSAWDILEPDSLALTISNSSLQLVLSMRRFQTPEDAVSNAEKTARAGDPDVQSIKIPIQTLPAHSWAEAEDGRLIVLTTVYANIHIAISLSESAWKINEPEKAVALLANIAKLQIDKLALLTKQ